MSEQTPEGFRVAMPNNGEANRNGDAYDPEMMKAALKKFIGKPVTVALLHDVEYGITKVLPPELPEPYEIVDAKVVGDRIECTARRKSNTDQNE